MANQAFSQSDDLMVGAGELYFQRDDDKNGLHHLGNVDEFNITNDVTTVEKNSSMNKRRELMASVTTAVAATGSITMTEYNPYNLALGLFGTEGIHTQVAQDIVDELYVIPSVPGIIRLQDVNNNPFYNVTDVALRLVVPKPATFDFGTDGTIIDGSGLVINITGTYTGLADKTYYLRIKTAALGNGDTSGLVLELDTMPTFKTGNLKTITSTGGSATESYSSNMFDGLTIDVDATNGAGTAAVVYQIKCKASQSELTNGVDYQVDEQSLRAGIIKIKESKMVGAGESVYISYKVPKADLVNVSGASAGEISGKLLFVGDPNNGDQYVLEGYKVKVKPDGDLTGLIGSDFGSFSLTVNFLADYENHPDAPFYLVTKVGNAATVASSNGVYDPHE